MCLIIIWNLYWYTNYMYLYEWKRYHQKSVLHPTTTSLLGLSEHFQLCFCYWPNSSEAWNLQRLSDDYDMFLLLSSSNLEGIKSASLLVHMSCFWFWHVLCRIIVATCPTCLVSQNRVTWIKSLSTDLFFTIHWLYNLII